ncbi:hypothetical protein [Bradyrhizobium sp. AS23.2]|nr:hypothetical protein [Bradyrhizobium sp. AS23.2]
MIDDIGDLLIRESANGGISTLYSWPLIALPLSPRSMVMMCSAGSVALTT